MKIKLHHLILAALLVALGYIGRLVQDAMATAPNLQSIAPKKVEKVYDVSEVRAERTELRDQRISIVGALYAGPGHQYVLIPDDARSMQPDRLPPDNPIEYGIRLPDWRFRDIKEGSIYCGITVSGSFGGELDPSLDALAPIDSVSWRPNATKKTDGEQGGSSNGG